MSYCIINIHAHLSPSAYAMLQWACSSVGAILVTINPAYRIHELVGWLCHRFAWHVNPVNADRGYPRCRCQSSFSRATNPYFFVLDAAFRSTPVITEVLSRRRSRRGPARPETRRCGR